MTVKRVFLGAVLFAAIGSAAGADSLATLAPAVPAAASLCPTNSGRVQIFRSSTSASGARLEMRQVLNDQRNLRSELLAVLSPAHRMLLGQIVGELAVAAEPDLPREAARINAALTSTEIEGVTRIERDHESAMLRRFAAMAAVESRPMPMLASGAGAVSRATPPNGPMPYGSDAGSILVRTAAGGMLLPPQAMFEDGPGRR